jgi:hypothetical protein
MSSANSYPEICLEVGLKCEDCTSAAARQLAAICKGLRGKAVGQLFVQIYPDPACARMHSHFAASYRDGAAEATVRPAVVLEPRREVTFARPRVLCAVA